MTDETNSQRREIKSASLDEALGYARALISADRFDEAEQLLGKVLEALPRQFDALFLQASLCYHRDRFEEARDLLQRALAESPGNPGLLSNLGNTLVSIGQFEEAGAAYAEAIRNDPHATEPLNNLAMLMSAFDMTDDAETLLRRAIELDPGYGLAHLNLSHVLARKGDYQGSIDIGMRALTLMPRYSASHHLLVIAHLHNNDIEAANGVLDEWIRKFPDDPEADHIKAAVKQARPPSRASDEFVETVFDRFADSFDAKLAKLEYKAPSLIVELVRDVIPQARRESLRILDAGCGTGLCGPLLRDMASRLEGVDLSGRMLEKAERLGCYDLLERAELTAFIGGRKDAYDVIVSADTLCYFGDLAPVFSVCARALSPGGLLFFSLEKAKEAREDGFVLSPTGRYQHDAGQIRTGLALAGFEIVEIRDATLRTEKKLPVSGLVVAARRSR